MFNPRNLKIIAFHKRVGYYGFVLSKNGDFNVGSAARREEAIDHQYYQILGDDRYLALQLLLHPNENARKIIKKQDGCSFRVMEALKLHGIHKVNKVIHIPFDKQDGYYVVDMLMLKTSYADRLEILPSRKMRAI